MKVYFNKIQNTSDKTITKFYFNKYDNNYNNLEFLKNKIAKLLTSEKTTDSVKKQLTRLQKVNFEKYDCFYIYSNSLCFGINTQNKTIDFYKNEYDAIIKIDGYAKKYNCKIDGARASGSDTIDASDFVPSEK